MYFDKKQQEIQLNTTNNVVACDALKCISSKAVCCFCVAATSYKRGSKYFCAGVDIVRFAPGNEFFRFCEVLSSPTKRQPRPKDQLGATNMRNSANYFDDGEGLAAIGLPGPPTDDEVREWHAVKFFRHAAEEENPIDAGDWVSSAIGEICRIDDRHVLNHRHWREVQQWAPFVRERLAGLPDSHAPIAGKGVLAFLRVADELFEVGDIRAAYRQFNDAVNTRHIARVAGRTLYQLSRDRALSTTEGGR